ncbi:MAG: GAF domain-containing protein, partial [Anaerolineae bacterium]
MTESKPSVNQLPTLNAPTLEDFFSVAAARDLPEMLSRALQIVGKTFGAEAGSLFFFSRPAQHIKIGDSPPPVAAYISQLEQAVAGRLRRGTWRVVQADAGHISSKKFPAHAVIVLNAPLLKDTRVVGSLSVVLADAPPPGLIHRTTLTRLAQGIGQLASFAADLSLAQQRYRELDLIYQVGQALATTLDISELLNNVIQLSANVLNAAAASIILIDEARQELVFEASHNPAPSVRLKKHRIRIDEGIAGWVATNSRPVVVNDVHADPRFSQKVDVRTGFLTQSIAAVPIRLKGKTVGVLEVLNKKTDGGFDNNDLRLMTSIAAQTAIALENATLYQSLREERDKIIKAQEEVRKELSRNLHDGAVQQLSAISMNLEYAKKLMTIDPNAAINELTGIQALAHKAAKEARLVLFELRPIILETQGLLPALERYVEQLNDTEELVVEAELSPIPVPLKKDVAGTVFSIIQEAVNNV